jgi:hypothetical protein
MQAWSWAQPTWLCGPLSMGTTITWRWATGGSCRQQGCTGRIMQAAGVHRAGHAGSRGAQGVQPWCTGTVATGRPIKLHAEMQLCHLCFVGSWQARLHLHQEGGLGALRVAGERC